jgi:hypothetical protein
MPVDFEIIGRKSQNAILGEFVRLARDISSQEFDGIRLLSVLWLRRRWMPASQDAL